NSGSRSFGRPRCETSTRDAPWSSSSLMVGRAAWIRVSSATLPSASGTLKSTRTSACRPSTLKPGAETLALLKLPWTSVTYGSDLGREFDNAVRVAPLVVVPGDDLDEGALDDHG